MLTKTEKKNIDICSDVITGKFKEKELAVKYNVTARTIQRAIAWGRHQGLFITDSEEKIIRNIYYLQKILYTLETQFLIVNRAATKEEKKGNVRYIKELIDLADIILDYNTRIMELEGLYHNVHLHLYSGEMQHEYRLSEPLQKMLEKITEQKYNENGSKNSK